MKAKINYANGESEIISLSTKTEVIDLVKAYPWEKEQGIVDGIVGFKGYPEIIIQKESGDSITISCLWHDSTLLHSLEFIYRKYFYWDQIYSVRNTFDDLLELVVCFLDNEPSMFISRIKRRRHIILPAYIRISFRKQSFYNERKDKLRSEQYRRYRFNYTGPMYISLFTLAFAILTIMSFVLVFISSPLVIFMALMLASFSFPDVILYYRHYESFKNSAVIFAMNNNRFSLYHNSSHRVFDKSMIKDIVKVCHRIIIPESTGRDFYFFWRITFTEGDPVFISSLLMSDSDILREFNINIWVVKTESTPFSPIIKKPFAL